MAQLPIEFRADLDSYRGPLDLLLYLIKKEEVDIFDIPVSRITAQYLDYLQILQAIDPNVCGEFLVMAAQLMEIKSRTLLPVEVQEEAAEDLEDPRLELVLQLLEYKKYKERSLLLERMIEEHARKYRRPEMDLPVESAEEVLGPMPLGNVTIWDLLTAFQKVQIALSMRQPHRVLFEDRPIEEFMKAIRDRLEAAAGEPFYFERLFDQCRDRYDAIGFFLALLEMVRQRLVAIRQEELFGPIEIALAPPLAEPPPQPVGAEAETEAPGEALPPEASSENE